MQKGCDERTIPAGAFGSARGSEPRGRAAFPLQRHWSVMGEKDIHEQKSAESYRSRQVKKKERFLFGSHGCSLCAAQHTTTAAIPGTAAKQILRPAVPATANPVADLSDSQPDQSVKELRAGGWLPPAGCWAIPRRERGSTAQTAGGHTHGNVTEHRADPGIWIRSSSSPHPSGFSARSARFLKGATSPPALLIYGFSHPLTPAALSPPMGAWHRAAMRMRSLAAALARSGRAAAAGGPRGRAVAGGWRPGRAVVRPLWSGGIAAMPGRNKATCGYGSPELAVGQQAAEGGRDAGGRSPHGDEEEERRGAGPEHNLGDPDIVKSPSDPKQYR